MAAGRSFFVTTRRAYFSRVPSWDEHHLRLKHLLCGYNSLRRSHSIVGVDNAELGVVPMYFGSTGESRSRWHDLASWTFQSRSNQQQLPDHTIGRKYCIAIILSPLIRIRAPNGTNEPCYLLSWVVCRDDHMQPQESNCAANRHRNSARCLRNQPA
jgi:hypothetical protein